MNRISPFDDLLKDLLDDGPNTAPGIVLETVRAALPSVAQRRPVIGPPWRAPRLTPQARLRLAGAAVGILILAMILVVQPGFHHAIGTPPVATPAPAATARASASPISDEPQASAQPLDLVPPLSSDRFYSAFMGYTIAIDTSWSVKMSSRLWTGTEVVGPGDEIDLTGTDSSFWGASQALPAGTTYQEFLDGVDANETSASGNSSCPTAPSPWAPVSLTRGSAMVEHVRCDGTHEAFATAAGRVFGFALTNRTSDATQHASPFQLDQMLYDINLAPGPSSGTSSTSVPPLTSNFHSPTRGYSIRIPKGWKIRPDHSLSDEFDGPAGAVIEVASQAVPAGTDLSTFEEQLAAHPMVEQPGNPRGEITSTAGETAVAGLPALMLSYDASGPAGTEATFIVVDDGLAYFFTFADYYTDLDLSRAILETIVLSPDSAP
jgi:hypothetical protein